MKVQKLTQEHRNTINEIWIANFDSEKFEISSKIDKKTNIATQIKTSLKKEDIVVYEVKIKGVTVTAYYHVNTNGHLFKMVRSNGEVIVEIPKEQWQIAIAQLEKMGLTFI